MQLIRQVRKTGFTIAPEAGSQRLRDVINKNITRGRDRPHGPGRLRDGLAAGQALLHDRACPPRPTRTSGRPCGWFAACATLRGPGGPPGSAQRELRRLHPQAAHALSVGVPDGAARRRGRRSAGSSRELALPGVEFKWQNPEMSLLEGVLARGDRRLGAAVEAAFRRGCRFDGWGDRLDLRRWQAAFAEIGIDPDFYTTRPARPGRAAALGPHRHPRGQILPEGRVGEGRGRHGHRRLPRRPLQRLRQLRFRPGPAPGAPPHAGAAGPRAPRLRRPAAYKKIQVSYSKMGPARFFGHLELVNLFLRALRRAAIPVKYSEGFHPKPKVAFDDPLPTGFESEEERMVVTVAADLAPQPAAGRAECRAPRRPAGARVHGVHRGRPPDHPLPHPLPGSLAGPGAIRHGPGGLRP